MGIHYDKKGEIIPGSRHHFLDWVESGNFPETLNKLLIPTNAKVNQNDFWAPKGNGDISECKLDSEKDHRISCLCDWKKISDWWLVHKQGANVPNWDLLATCNIEEKKGLVLVEGKAHEHELDVELKEKGLTQEQRLSVHSLENHEQIGRAIEEARAALSKKFPSIQISSKSHYQLSNRVAYAWKIASMGVPVVLIYLGFIGDSYFPDHFVNDMHWQNYMQRHMEGIVPPDVLESPIACGKARMLMIVRSKVITPSPSVGDGKV